MSSMYEHRRRAEAAHGAIDDMRDFAADMREAVELLNRYGEARFGDDWNPEHAESVLDDSTAAKLRQRLRQLS